MERQTPQLFFNVRALGRDTQAQQPAAESFRCVRDRVGFRRGGRARCEYPACEKQDRQDANDPGQQSCRSGKIVEVWRQQYQAGEARA